MASPACRAGKARLRPPANVPPLENTKIEGTLRQRMELHRKNPVCAACHNTIDPMGFAFENFDGVGKYRVLDARNPINATGQLPDGTKFAGINDFRTLMIAKKEQFLYTLANKLTMYAVGRGTESFDAPAVRKVVRDSAASNYKFSTIVLNVVKSTPF